ncbi:MAG: molybdenum cofactor biosynthesis protein [Firmicutes bacterium]|nr:molybdenum cofactor biosynthesis protein [Bacillota bacterium]
MGSHDHKEKAADIGPIRFGMITVSDTRTAENDESGKLAVSLLEGAGNIRQGHVVIPNDAARIEETVRGLLSEGCDLVITSGGTGIGRKDLSIDTCRKFFQKELQGFGELFRLLSYDQISSAAMMSRAAAGTVDGRIIVCLPGSAAAVRLALEKLLLPELQHLFWELRR